MPTGDRQSLDDETGRDMISREHRCDDGIQIHSPLTTISPPGAGVDLASAGSRKPVDGNSSQQEVDPLCRMPVQVLRLGRRSLTKETKQKFKNPDRRTRRN